MKNIILILLALSVSACNIIKSKSDPPVCRSATPIGVTAVEPVRLLTRILVYGDGFGAGGIAESVAKQAGQTCKDLGGCHFGLYLGDIYRTGADTQKELEEKVLNPMRNWDFHMYFTLGNHEYAGDVQAFYDLAQEEDKIRLPCNQYQVTDDNSYTFMIIDTNWPEQAGQPGRVNNLCNAMGFRALVGHHPLWSNSEKSRADEEEKTRSYFEAPLRKCAHAVFSGHDHHGELIVNDGLVQVVEGRGGRSTREVLDVGQAWIEKGYGFAILEIPLLGFPALSFYNELGDVRFDHSFGL